MMRKFIACLSIITVFMALMTTSTVHGQGIEWQCPEIIQRDKIAKPSEALYFILSYADGRNELWYSDGTVLYSKVYEFRFSGEANSVYAKISPDKSKLALTLVKTDGDPRFVEDDVEVKVISLDTFTSRISKFTVSRSSVVLPDDGYPYSLFWGWVDNGTIAFNLNAVRLTFNLSDEQATQIDWLQFNQNTEDRRLLEPGDGRYIYYVADYYAADTVNKAVNTLRVFDTISQQFTPQRFDFQRAGYRLSFSDDGKRLALLDPSDALTLIEPEANKIRYVIRSGWTEYDLTGYLNPSHNLLSVMWHGHDRFTGQGRMYAISLSPNPTESFATLKPLCLNGFMNYYAGFPSWLGDEYYQFLINIDDKPQWYIYHAPTHTLTDVMPSELLQEFREANTRLTVAGWGQFPAK